MGIGLRALRADQDSAFANCATVFHVGPLDATRTFLLQNAAVVHMPVFQKLIENAKPAPPQPETKRPLLLKAVGLRRVDPHLFEHLLDWTERGKLKSCKTQSPCPIVDGITNRPGRFMQQLHQILDMYHTCVSFGIETLKWELLRILRKSSAAWESDIRLICWIGCHLYHLDAQPIRQVREFLMQHAEIAIRNWQRNNHFDTEAKMLMQQTLFEDLIHIREKLGFKNDEYFDEETGETWQYPEEKCHFYRVIRILFDSENLEDWDPVAAGSIQTECLPLDWVAPYVGREAADNMDIDVELPDEFGPRIADTRETPRQLHPGMVRPDASHLPVIVHEVNSVDPNNVKRRRAF